MATLSTLFPRSRTYSEGGVQVWAASSHPLPVHRIRANRLEGVPGEGESCPARSQRGRQHHGGGLGDGPGGEGKGSSQSLGVGEDEAAASRRNIGGDGGGEDGEVLPGGIGEKA